MKNNKGVIIESINRRSMLFELGVRPNDALICIDNKRIRDVLDVMFYSADNPKVIEINRDSQRISLHIPKESNTNIFSGVNFQPFRIKTCRNNCIFCFVNQMPKGLRKSLYVKDEDYRMSFLYGNYITLSNLTEYDKKRIIQQRISPLYISVHATDTDVRNSILRNKNAPNIMNELKTLVKGKIRMHTQVVVCPDINDGEVLEKTILDLYKLYPYVMSIAVVPVGITAHRKEKLKGFDKERAIQVLSIVNKYHQRFRKKHGEGIVYPADEMFIKAEMPIPPLKYYDDLPQIENGVGMVAQFLHQAKHIKYKRLTSMINQNNAPHITTFTGTSFLSYLTEFVKNIQSFGINIRAIGIKNSFFGDTVTVTGLLSGRDVIKALEGDIEKNSVLLIPDVCLKEGDKIFIDDVSTDDIEGILNVKTRIIKSNPSGLIKGILDVYNAV
ncbi:MAG: DUF512 domain-containing protein [Thermodesulfovibrionales bacterium]|nr:DUF512 domain-containing protein [Thermodesulfovibrionales bacterium]